MKVLVLGGAGMLGQAVEQEARSRGWDVLALSREQADVTDRPRLLEQARVFGPEVVINCAAYTKVDLCETEVDRAFAINGEGAGNAAVAAESVEARLVHVSTDYVFDGQPGGNPHEPYREDAPTGPLSVYGKSKLEGERRALEYDRALVVRTSWLFGPGGPNFVATMVRLIEAGQVPLRVVDDQVGGPTYTPFLAKALLDLSAAGATGVVHYQNREPVSWYAFATQIARQWGDGTGKSVEVQPVTTADVPRPAPRPAWSVLDVTRFEEIAGRPVERWDQGLTELLAGMRKGRSQ